MHGHLFPSHPLHHRRLVGPRAHPLALGLGPKQAPLGERLARLAHGGLQQLQQCGRRRLRAGLKNVGRTRPLAQQCVRALLRDGRADVVRKHGVDPLKRVLERQPASHRTLGRRDRDWFKVPHRKM
eukprot:6211252-Pleurochrysis_carterae.AAC.2